jgi:hypothetical protein
VTNTLAYFGTESITAAKSFIAQEPSLKTHHTRALKGRGGSGGTRPSQSCSILISLYHKGTKTLRPGPNVINFLTAVIYKCS